RVDQSDGQEDGKGEGKQRLAGGEDPPLAPDEVDQITSTPPGDESGSGNQHQQSEQDGSARVGQPLQAGQQPGDESKPEQPKHFGEGITSIGQTTQQEA